MDEKTQGKVSELQELLKQKDVIERKIAALFVPEKVLPPDFSINSEIFRVVKDAGSTGIAKSYVLKALQTKYPDYGIDRKKVASSLAYLKNNKKQVEIIGRGMYKAVDSP